VDGIHDDNVRQLHPESRDFVEALGDRCTLPSSSRKEGLREMIDWYHPPSPQGGEEGGGGTRVAAPSTATATASLLLRLFVVLFRD